MAAVLGRFPGKTFGPPSLSASHRQSPRKIPAIPGHFLLTASLSAPIPTPFRAKPLQIYLPANLSGR